MFIPFLLYQGMLMHRGIKYFSVFIVLTFILGCGGGSLNDDSLNCIQVENYDDPLVIISSAIDSSTSEHLAQVELSNLMRENIPKNFHQLRDEYLNRIDIVDNGERAICTLPCTLLTSQGEYSMEVSATAYTSKIITFYAPYDHFDDSSCTGTYSGSYELNIILDPAF